MNNELKIGFIGFGNMAQAMAKGLLAMDVCQSSQIFACAAHFDKLQKNTEALGVTALQTGGRGGGKDGLRHSGSEAQYDRIGRRTGRRSAAEKSGHFSGGGF